MAIHTDDLTARYLGTDPLKRIALVYQGGNTGRLSCHVVELQDERVYKPAVGAVRRGQQPENVFSRHRSSAFARRAGLLAVQLPARPNVVRSAPLAPRLAHVEVGQRQVFFASSTAPHSGRYDWWCRSTYACRGPRTDATSPDACRAERDSEFARDRSQRQSLRAKPVGLTLLVCLRCRHPNICSITART
jgi:hypothetical protein